MNEAADTIHIGSASGMLFAFVFFLAFSLTIGYVVYSLLARPETRRAEFIRMGAVSRRASLVIAGSLSGGLFVLICWTMFTGFHRIDVEGEQLRLHYLIPPRTAIIRRDELTLLEKKFAYRMVWRLSVSTLGGETYESQTGSVASIEAARLRLAQLAAE
ncbi:MAG: hypothetical protein EXQ56_08050 [Acidobacteria bacterium]|nr:hypothetical protein [Acidobacteriota bacterium]